MGELLPGCGRAGGWGRQVRHGGSPRAWSGSDGGSGVSVKYRAAYVFVHTVFLEEGNVPYRSNKLPPFVLLVVKWRSWRFYSACRILSCVFPIQKKTQGRETCRGSYKSTELWVLLVAEQLELQKIQRWGAHCATRGAQVEDESPQPPVPRAGHPGCQ